MSSPRILSRDPRTPSRRTTDIPIGLGRWGERVAKSPRFFVSRGGVTCWFQPRL
jgi:hypothetical protein